MKLRWIAAAAGLALLLRASSADRVPAAASGLRRHFARIARMRLIAACPKLDGRLRERTLRDTFDWIIAEMYRRTGTSSLDALARWAGENGKATTEQLMADVARESVDQLPRSVLWTIDKCRGRMFAGVLICEALTEAGRRVAPVQEAGTAAPAG